MTLRVGSYVLSGLCQLIGFTQLRRFKNVKNLKTGFFEKNRLFLNCDSKKASLLVKMGSFIGLFV